MYQINTRDLVLSFTKVGKVILENKLKFAAAVGSVEVDVYNPASFKYCDPFPFASFFAMVVVILRIKFLSLFSVS